jgi:photosystem II stability/assembly factor-like uncharacterized protein
MSDLLVGTSNGLLAVSENGGWRVKGHYLQGQDIAQVARTADPQTFLVASHGGGLTRLNVESGAVEPVGAGVLPEGIRCVAVAPSDPNTIFIGTEPVGIFVSRDGGRSWSECEEVARMAQRLKWGYPVPSVQPHIRDIVIDRSNPNRLFAAVQVGAVIVSEDGGKTWRDTGGQMDADVHSVVQDPSDPSVLYACAGGGGSLTMATLDQYPPPLPEGRPIYRSKDSGRSWECISLDFERTYGVSLRVHPRDPALLLAAVGRGIPPFWRKRPERADAVVVVSRDRGKTWSQSTEGLPGHFALMVEAIEIGPGPRHRAFIGTGGEGMKVADGPQGEIYVSDEVEHGWHRIPLDFPSIATLTAS